MEDFHVLIIGAGITGLLLAQALQNHHIPYTIFESSPSASAYKPRQWGLSIHWSTPLLKKLLPERLWTRIHEAQCDPFYQNPEVENLNIYDGTTGEVMTTMPEPGHIRFNRGRMREFCARGVDVQYNKKLTTLLTTTSDDGKKTITASFEDDTSATGSLVVGADGTNSKVRHLLLGDEKAAAKPASTPENPFIFTNSTVQYSRAEQALFLRQLHPTFYTCLHPDGGLFWVSPLDIPSPSDPRTWRFQLFMNWRLSPSSPPVSDPSNVLPELKAWAPKLVDPWKSAIEWLPDDTVIEMQKIQYWQPIARDNWGGRVTLAGDAGHAMVPFRGQGLSHCIADITSLVSHLTSHLHPSDTPTTLADAINAYDTEVISRAGDEVSTSLQTMHFLMTWEKVQQSPSFKRSADPNEAAVRVLGLGVR